MRALLIGAGRMGLTHLALFNLLTDMQIKWTVVEPSLILRLGIKQALSRHMIEACANHIPLAKEKFDFAVITSPTMHHADAYAAAAPLARKCFIEKPLRVVSATPNTLCGYVLLHHPLQKMVKQFCEGRVIVQARLSLKANTIISPNNGWRGHLATGGGVLNEFGSHLISLLVDVAGPVKLISMESAKTVYSVDAPDQAELSGETEGGAAFSLSLDWSDNSVRKPVYGVTLTFADGATTFHDFYEAVLGDRRLSIADNATQLDAYLRGIEFTNQARYFLDHEDFTADLAIATEVDRILSGINDYPR
jgi:predicted dehydrogenase